tara:strand:+ start:59 stop:562 length:504 start_codon:yes stop_codon:yes gene_type:complete
MQSLHKIIIVFFIIFTSSVNAENDSSSNKWSFYTGMFDFSDDGKKSNLFGIQHINENLYRESFLGRLQPVTGAFMTADNAAYIYTGFQIPYESGSLKITPSFTPGLYDDGDGKDLGHVIEFKSEIQISFNLTSDSEIGISYNHLSNASLGSKNPGANSYIINFIKEF